MCRTMNGKGSWYKRLEQSVRILEMVTDLFLRSDFQIDKKRTKKKLFQHGKDL